MTSRQLSTRCELRTGRGGRGAGRSRERDFPTPCGARGHWLVADARGSLLAAGGHTRADERASTLERVGTHERMGTHERRHVGC